MKTLLIVCSLALLSGCANSALTSAPVEDKAKTSQLRAIDARAMELAKTGMSYRNAYARAEGELTGEWASFRRLEPRENSGAGQPRG
jgi:hypothetical protein